MMCDFRDEVEVGCFMSYGPNLEDLFRRTAGLVDRILRGTKPAVIPVEQPTKFELVINLNTAKALGFTIPQSLLLRADRHRVNRRAFATGLGVVLIAPLVVEAQQAGKIHRVVFLAVLA